MSTTLSSSKSSPALDALTAVGVARQSRTRDETMSVPDQVERMSDSAERNGWNLSRVFEEEDVSGRRPLDRRPGLKRALAEIEAGRAQVLVVAYFDRLCRSLKVQAEVVERVEAAGGRVFAVDSGEVTSATAAGWLSSQMLGMMAEYYARSVGERTAESKARNVARGVPPFPRITPAYERNEDGTLRQSAAAPLVREACELRASGMSYARIARFLAERGLSLGVSGVESMLRSPLLYGEIRFGKLVNANGVADPVIDRSLFRRMHSAKATRGRYSKSERLLARLGVLTCETCGARLTVDTALRGKGEARREYSYYRCGNRLCEAPAIVSADRAEEVVRDEAIRLSADVVGHASAASDLELARLARVAAEEKLASAIRTLIGFGDEVATKEVLDELQAERDAAVAKHERLEALTTPDRTLRTSADWDRLTYDERRAVIHAVVETALVAPGRGSDRITVEGRLAK